MLLLQNSTPPDVLTAADGFTMGQKVITGMLALIFSLICYIWNTNRAETKERHEEQKRLADRRHEDTMKLFNKIEEKVDSLESHQLEQGYQIFTLNGVINLSQGKEFNYNNPPPKKTRHDH